MDVVRNMGVIITIKSNVFKQNNKISSEPIYPIYLKELTVVNSYQYGVIQQ